MRTLVCPMCNVRWKILPDGEGDVDEVCVICAREEECQDPGCACGDSGFPALCSGCRTLSEPRTLGETPEGWSRDREDQGRYWCPECTGQLRSWPAMRPR